MRAWRTHEYGPRPTEVLRLDTVPLPEPDAGEVRVRVQAIPLNLNDLERVNGGNMMVRPDLPYSPGMEVMGVVDACGPGAEAWQGRRVVATTKGAHGGFAEYAVCPVVSMFDMPDAIPLPDAAALLLPVPPRLARALRPRRAGAGRAGVDPRRRGRVGVGRDPARQAPRRVRVRDRGHRREDRAVPRARRRRGDQLQHRRLRRGGARGDRQARRRGGLRQRRRSRDGSVDAVHRVQRPVSHDGLCVEQGRRRRTVHRSAPNRTRERQTLRCAARVRGTRRWRTS